MKRWMLRRSKKSPIKTEEYDFGDYQIYRQSPRERVDDKQLEEEVCVDNNVRY